MSAAIIVGGCFCGAVRYRLSGEPTESLVCHCESCRRIAGSPLVGWITVPKAALHFTRGVAANFRSSPTVVRGFCQTCGTPLTYESTAHPFEVDLTTCSLDDPDAFPPTYHTWTSDAVSWIRLADDLQTYAESSRA